MFIIICCLCKFYILAHETIHWVFSKKIFKLFKMIKPLKSIFISHYSLSSQYSEDHNSFIMTRPQRPQEIWPKSDAGKTSVNFWFKQFLHPFSLLVNVLLFPTQFEIPALSLWFAALLPAHVAPKLLHTGGNSVPLCTHVWIKKRPPALQGSAEAGDLRIAWRMVFS